MRHRTATLAPSAVACALLLSACTASPDPTPAASPTSASPSPADTAEYAAPGVTAGDISYLVYDPARDVVENTMQSEVVAGVDIALAGECRGGAVDFDVLAAAPGEGSGDVLLAGTLDCADGIDDGFSYSLPYAGAVQIRLGDTRDVDAAWIAVRPVG